MNETNQIKIREIFSILTQGIEVLQYEVDRSTGKSNVHGRIFWIDSDIYRLCIDTYRPTIADRVKGFIPPGVYLRDISEVRAGLDSYHFRKHKKAPVEPTHCLSLVASERTVTVEFPSKFTRDWFYERFILMSNDIIGSTEQLSRRFRLRRTNIGNNSVASRDDIDRFRVLLDRGFEVMHHDRSGVVQKAILSFHGPSNSFVLKPVKSFFLKFFKVEPLRILLDDVSEVRPGSHSYGFVKTNSTDLDNETFALIGTEAVFELQLINTAARDLMVERIYQFIQQYSKQSNNNLNTLDYLVPSSLLNSPIATNQINIEVEP
mmetsp:Transcript_26523/g.28926  ORF Transcript_26523/g.28926 Transcript_26523/m.28926 type:complete len:319 (+) Transcript_26523:304-1260(+)